MGRCRCVLAAPERQTFDVVRRYRGEAAAADEATNQARVRQRVVERDQRGGEHGGRYCPGQGQDGPPTCKLPGSEI